MRDFTVYEIEYQRMYILTVLKHMRESYCGIQVKTIDIQQHIRSLKYNAPYSDSW